MKITTSVAFVKLFPGSTYHMHGAPLSACTAALPACQLWQNSFNGYSHQMSPKGLNETIRRFRFWPESFFTIHEHDRRKLCYPAFSLPPSCQSQQLLVRNTSGRSHEQSSLCRDCRLRFQAGESLASFGTCRVLHRVTLLRWTMARCPVYGFWMAVGTRKNY